MAISVKSARLTAGCCFSRTLHRHSRWRSGKFVAINCAAIPESLIESELFGYQPG
ncbi:hypothetical protein CQA70_29230, partial [Klebsiella pneumoniae]